MSRTLKKQSYFDGTALVSQDNLLLEASYKLTLEEKRLVIASIARIDPRKPVPNKITLTADSYAETFGLDMKNAYEQLKNASDRLYERDIKFKEGKDSARMRWVSKVVYHKSKGSVSLHFSSHITPYLSFFQEQFTQYRLAEIKSLKSVYSIRLYELLSQYKSKGVRWMLVDDFREMFELKDSYPKFADLKRWVIMASVKELNQKSNFDVSVEWEKKGRSVHKIWFYFTEKKQIAMDI